MIRERFENLSGFALRRWTFKRIMAWNGLKNVLFVFKNQEYLNECEQEPGSAIIFRNKADFEGYLWGNRLAKQLQQPFLSNGSVLFGIVIDKRIIAYCWLNDSFDPNGDMELLEIREYYLSGPMFVEKEFRGNRMAQQLKIEICSYARKEKQFPIYAVNSFDNIPVIKANTRSGFKLYGIIFKKRNGNLVIKR